MREIPSSPIHAVDPTTPQSNAPWPLSKDTPVKAEDLEEILVNVTPTAKNFAVGQPFHIEAAPQINAALAFNIPWQTHSSGIACGSNTLPKNSSVTRQFLEVVKKVRLRSDIPMETPLGALVTIRTKQGEEFQAGVDIPRGSETFTPLTREEKREKFRANVYSLRTVDIEKAERASSSWKESRR